MKIYFAGPLFSEAERDWIRSTINKIESLAAQRGTKIEIIFPYDLITQEEIDRLGEHAKVEIFSRCKSHLDDAGLVIAMLDGSPVDDGTAWEIGYSYLPSELKLFATSSLTAAFRDSLTSEPALSSPETAVLAPAKFAVPVYVPCNPE